MSLKYSHTQSRAQMMGNDVGTVYQAGEEKNGIRIPFQVSEVKLQLRLRIFYFGMIVVEIVKEQLHKLRFVVCVLY